MRGGGGKSRGEMKRTGASMPLGYNERHAKSGLTASLPTIETFPNQYKGYEITIEIPEYTAICPQNQLARLRRHYRALHAGS
jgi:7-cyano-7-deazaguanine reductase